jgi:hypothetical protein
MTYSPTALDLPMVTPLPDATQKYFDICQDKLGMVPNVLQAYAFNIDKLNAFTTLYMMSCWRQRPVELDER